MEQHERSKIPWMALGGALVVMAALLAGFSAGSPRQALAAEHPGVNFTVAVPGYSGCDTSAGNAQCYIPPGTTFTVNVTLGSLPSDVPGHEGYDIKLAYSGVTSQDNASVDSWPDCAYPAYTYDTAGVVQMGCAIGIDSTASTYTGLVGTAGFTCAASGSITLEHGSGSTDLFQSISQILWEPGGSETLNITCGSPPTATTPPTATRAPGLGPSGVGDALDGNDGTTALWLAIASLGALTMVALAAMSWRLSRGR
jgi:hypothetical protein